MGTGTSSVHSVKVRTCLAATRVNMMDHIKPKLGRKWRDVTLHCETNVNTDKVKKRVENEETY